MPQTRICSFYHAYFGPSFLMMQAGLLMDINQGWSYWNMILSSCLCIRSRYINWSKLQHITVFPQHPLETWDNWKASWFFAEQNIRTCFAFIIIILCLPSSVFHVLDSLLTSNWATTKVHQLQRIFLKYFDQEIFKGSWISVNVPQVPHHPSFFSIC